MLNLKNPKTKYQKQKKLPEFIDIETDLWSPEAVGRGAWAKWVKGVKRYRLPVIK